MMPVRKVAMLSLAFTGMGWCAFVHAATPEECAKLRLHGDRTKAKACYDGLVQSASSYLRAEGYWGLEQYTEANDEFRKAVSQADGNALYRVRWGMLLYERFNPSDAAGLFNEALQRDAKNA